MSIILTQEQEDTINGVKHNQAFGRTICATVSGPAGTGKTFTVNEIKKVLNGSIASIAPTHTAAKLIGGETIHSFFQLRPLDPDSPVLEFNNNYQAKKDVDTIILDECSMVDDYTISNIRSYCVLNDINLITVGDEYQLPPVGSTDMNACFDPNYFQQWPLTQIVRQKAGSSIIGLSSLYRQYNHIPDWKVISGKTPEVIDSRWNTQWEVLFEPHNQKHIIVGYTNKSVSSINRKINSDLYNDNWLFHDGDVVVLRQPVWYVSGEYYDEEAEEMKTRYSMLSTGSEVIIDSVSKGTCPVVELNGIETKLHGYQATLGLDAGTVRQRFILDYDSYSEYERIKKAYKTASKKATSSAAKDIITARWKLSGMKGIIPVYHRYACTVHLSQGKTFDKTFFMSPTLYGLKVDNNIQLHNRLAYVGFTRPEHQLIITGKIYD